MSLKERVYSVLIVSASESFNATVGTLLPSSKYLPVRYTADISAAKRALAERDYDYVIINTPLPDDVGTRFAIDASAGNAAVLLLVKTDLYEEITDKVASHGVFTLPKPTSRLIMATALIWMASARERMRRYEKKALTIEEKMEEIRIVNRAKWLLISELSMDEPEAHRYIEKQAMDQCVSKRKVSEDIIKTYS